MAATTDARTMLRNRALFTSIFNDPSSRFFGRAEAVAIEFALSEFGPREAREFHQRADRTAEVLLRARMGEL